MQSEGTRTPFFKCWKKNNCLSKFYNQENIHEWKGNHGLFREGKLRDLNFLFTVYFLIRNPSPSRGPNTEALYFISKNFWQYKICWNSKDSSQEDFALLFAGRNGSTLNVIFNLPPLDYTYIIWKKKVVLIHLLIYMVRIKVSL